VNNINVRNNNYAYAHNPAAVTATTRAGFVNGQAVNRGATRVTAASLRGAQVTNHLNMTPTRASYAGAASVRGGRVATPPASVQNRAVIARTAPAAAATHMPVRTIGTSGYGAGRNNSNAGNRGAGNSTAHNGRATASYGSGSPNRPSYAGQGGSVNSQGAPRYNTNRPPSANQGGAYNQRGASSARPYNSAPQRGGYSASPQQRGYSAPPHAYSAPQQQRTYSAPPRAYSAPSRTYSAPSHAAPAPSHGPSGGGGGGGSRGGSGPHGR
jgi:hypothetical protein